MLKNYLKIALRNLRKNKLSAGLNILGLAMGLSIAGFLLLYIQDERSFNHQHTRIDRIHRVIVHPEYEGMTEKWANAPNAVGPAAKDAIAGVEEYVRLMKHNFGDKAFVNTDDKKLVETHLYWADSSLLEIFDLSIVQGNRSELLTQPNQVILSESTARKYFDDQDPLGKSLTVNNNYTLNVAGVFEDLPQNMSLDANMIGSFQTVRWMQRLTWSNSSYETFLLLNEQANPQTIETELANLLDQNVAEEEQWFSLSLQPLREVHLYSSDITNSYTSRLGDPQQLRLLILLVIIVLLIASINYMNMATARSQAKAKEVGITKTVGASRGNMIQRFYVETIALVGLALLMSVILIVLFLPFFNQLAGKSFHFTDILKPEFALGALTIAAVIVLLSGAYPAFYLSGFSPRSLFSNIAAEGQSRGSGIFRKGLVVSQFVASVVIIVATLVFFEQLRFIQHKNLGYRPDLVVGILTTGAENSAQVDGLINNLRQLPVVEHVGRAQTFPGNDASGRTITKPQHSDQTLLIQSNRITPEIVDLLDLKLLAGRTLPDRELTNEDSVVQVILNETALDFLGYTPEEAIGREAPGLFYRKRAEITGVVEDFHFQSFRQPIGGYILHNNPSEWRAYTLVKLKTDNLAQSMRQLRSVFERTVPNSAFDFTFLDQHLETLYRSEQKVARIFLVFAILTIVIACLGLFGLAAYTAERRTKEIGIRKVLGASVLNLFGVLSIDFIKLIVIALLIATPLAWYFMQNWLKDFAYHVDVPWWSFPVAGLMVIVIALLTVSFHSIRSAIANPVDALRNE